MAGAITAASIKYGVPVVAKVGDLLFTATQIETSGTLEEYVTGGIELKPAKLGLTDEAISGTAAVAREGEVGETATTTALPALIWCNPVMSTATQLSKAEAVTAGAIAQVSVVGKTPYLRVFSQESAGKKEPLLESVTADKRKLTSFATTVFALGK